MKIIDYHVVTCLTINALIEEVKKELSSGWQPIGGMTTISHPTGGNLELGPMGSGIKGTILFSQALVKYQPDPHISQLGGPG